MKSHLKSAKLITALLALLDVQMCLGDKKLLACFSVIKKKVMDRSQSKVDGNIISSPSFHGHGHLLR